MPYAKNKIKVNVPHRSGFDKSHRNCGTLTCGTLTPILCDELIPGTRVSLRLPIAVQMPPLASDTYMDMKLRAEAFFVPSRLLCASFEDWFCDSGNNEIFAIDAGSTIPVTPRIPYFTPANLSKLGPGSLADYLGIKVNGNGADPFSFNALPFLAYHLVYQEWYRNPRVQKPCFVRSLSGFAADPPKLLFCAPYSYFSSSTSQTANENLPDLGTAYLLADGFDVFELRQRNFGLDYFTGSRLSAQQGPAVSLNVPISGNDIIGVTDTDGNPANVLGEDTTSGFTIAALRAANSLQQFRERNNLPSPRLVDQVKARYGAILSDGVAQRPICIGTASYDVDSMGISQTGEVSQSPQTQPFDSVGAQYGRAYAAGSDFIISDFTANEPGYLLVLISLVPSVTYASGVDRMFLRYRTEGSIAEMANPLLQNVGDQPINDIEISTAGTGANYTHVLGYQDRFADFMYKSNSAHGKFRYGESLSAYVLQRSFSGNSAISQSSALLQIPKNYLDPVMAVSQSASGLSAWYDAKLQYKVSMPLAEFSIPSLQDPAYEHGKPVVLHRNGQIF